MKKNIKIFIYFFLLMISYSVSAQTCPSASSVTLTTTSTPNTCGGNGSITATFSPSGSSSNITVQLLKSGTELTSNTSGISPRTFNNLQPGTDYQIRLVCSTDNSIILKTNSVTVADNYVPISTANITNSNVCTNFTTGGTITVNSVTGGTAPYQYSIIFNSNANYDDTLSSYSTSNTKNVTQFGTYQVRIKDACGNFKTFSYTLSPTLPRVRYYWKPKAICNNTTQSTGITWYAWDPDLDGAADLTLHTNGLKMVIRDGGPSGTILYNGTLTLGMSSFTYTKSSTYTYYVTTTNACGLSVSYYHYLDSPEYNPEYRNFIIATGSSGCGVSEKMSIFSAFAEQSFWNYPLTAVVKNSSGTTVATQTINTMSDNLNVTNLPMGDYNVTITDACGVAVTKPANNPQGAGTPVLSVYATQNWRCGELVPITQNNTLQALIQITGYLPDRANANVKITAGPSNVGVQGTIIDGQFWGWTNLLPGTYIITYISCGVTRTGTFTIDPSNGSLLKQSFTATANSLCGGTGNIFATLQYNGAFQYDIELLNAAGTVIQTNNTGNFTNLPAGNYTVRAIVKPWCNGGMYNYIVDQPVNLTITAANSGASVSSSVGVICEDASGNPLSTGSAYLDIAGAGPFTLKYSTTSTGPWTTISNVGNNVTLPGLSANTLYYLQITDACGVLTNSTVQIKTIGTLSTTNTVHPCNNTPYTLAVPYYSGATYEWTNPQGAVVSNTRTYSVTNWDPSFNGTYIAKITWSNCVTRYVNVAVSSSQCGQPTNGACYKNPDLAAGIPTIHGITSLSRAGKNNADTSNWPMVRQSAHTVLESKTKGFVINRVATDVATGQVPTSVIPSPQEGMMIYDTTKNCLKIYDGTSWKCFTAPACPD